MIRLPRGVRERLQDAETNRVQVIRQDTGTTE